MIANCEAVATASQTTIMHPKTRQTGHNPEQDHHFGAATREIHGQRQPNSEPFSSGGEFVVL
jgi:hypothetical protein